MRKYVHIIILCGLFSLLSAPMAFAEEKLITADPDAILEAAKGYGRASLVKDNQGDPLIEGKIDGLLYSIVFYGCKNGKNCENIQFETGWGENAKKISLDDINGWNRKKLFVTSFINKDGFVRLRMDIMLQYGVTEKNLDACFDAWVSLMREFHITVMMAE